MSQIDDIMKKSGILGKLNLLFPEGQFEDILSSVQSNPDLFNVTDRSQIINPEALLQQVDMINPNHSDHRALYNKYLAILNNIKSQQEAAYQEYYNSPEQQVIRDKTAGLNPDILGLSGSQSAQAGMNEGSPYDGLPTQEELDAQKSQVNTARLSGLMSFVTSIANVVALPAQISSLISGKKLTDLQSGSQTLANLSSFEDLVSNEISSRLSDAIDSAIESDSGGLDIAEWFGNEDNFKNILETYRPDAGLMYDSSFANVRKRMQKNLAKAYENGKVTAENRYSFSALLADPWTDANVLIQAAQIEPYMKAKRSHEMALVKYQTKLADWQTKYQDALSYAASADAVNEKNEYDAEYYRNIDAEKMALWKEYQEEASAIASRLQSSIDKNLFDVYTKYPYNAKGFSAAYPNMAKAGLTWAEWLVVSEFMHSPDGSYNPSNLENLPTTGSVWHDWLRNPTGVAPIPSSARGFIPPGAPYL